MGKKEKTLKELLILGGTGKKEGGGLRG